jgi:hypothetical protein
MNRLLLIMTVLAVSVTGCSRQQKVESHSSGSIQGLVTVEIAPGNEITLGNLDVSLAAESMGVLAFTKTDDSGRFAFPKRPAGEYKLCLEGYGWEKKCISQIQIIRGDVYVPNVRLTLDRSSQRLVYGQIIFADGTPCYAVNPFLKLSLVGHISIKGSNRVFSVNDMGEFAFPSDFSSIVIEGACGSRSISTSIPAGTEAVERQLRLADPIPQIDNVMLLASPPGGTSKTFSLQAKPHSRKSKLRYSWNALDGLQLQSQRNSSSTWKAPDTSGTYPIYLVGTDDKGAFAIKSLSVRIGVPEIGIAAALSNPGPPLPAGHFLSFKQNDEATAKRYYGAIDPRNLRLTLGQWWTLNGFDQAGGGGTRTAYLNDNDLGIGRDMHCIEKPSGDIACYVTNYGDFTQNAESANLAWQADRDHALATVAMEYSAIEGAEGAGKIVKFYVFKGGNVSGPRLLSVSLETNGQEKYVPGLCVVCHGGTYSPDMSSNITPDEADLGSSFREFDLATFKYPTATPRSSQEASFKRLNEIVTDTKPAPAISDLVSGWYRSSAVQDNDFIPSDWKGDAQSKLYKNVVAKSCRTCHVALVSSYSNSVMSWTSYNQFQAEKGRIQSFVCGKNKFMPHAFVTFSNFWLRDDKSGPATLASFKDTNWDPPFGDCK